MSTILIPYHRNPGITKRLHQSTILQPNTVITNNVITTSNRHLHHSTPSKMIISPRFHHPNIPKLINPNQIILNASHGNIRSFLVTNNPSNITWMTPLSHLIPDNIIQISTVMMFMVPFSGINGKLGPLPRQRILTVQQFLRRLTGPPHRLSKLTSILRLYMYPATRLVFVTNLPISRHKLISIQKSSNPAFRIEIPIHNTAILALVAESRMIYGLISIRPVCMRVGQRIRIVSVKAPVIVRVVV